MRVAVVSEFYPRQDDPTLGIWAHRQALAARDAGAEVRVLVLYRPVPPRRAASLQALRAKLRQPRRAQLDGLTVDYVPFLSPPRPRSYGAWGAYAAPPLALALRRLRSRFAFDLVHAHNAVPAGDAVRRARLRGVPLVVSVHGGDVFFTAPHFANGRRNVERTFAAADLVLANSAGTERRARELGAREARVVHLGTDLPVGGAAGTAGGARAAGPAGTAGAAGAAGAAGPAGPAGPAAGADHERRAQPTLVTVANLDPRKRQGDVIRALWLLRARRPHLRYLVVGDGQERAALEALARELGVADRVDFAGRLDHAAALAAGRACSLFVMPSTDEAFGVAYVEAMAGGLPAIGSQGEPGPEEIARSGEGMRLVPPGDVEALAGEIEALLQEPAYLRELGERARRTVERSFTWEACGSATMAAYRDALRAR